MNAGPPKPSNEPSSARPDLRLVPIASAAWAVTWLATAEPAPAVGWLIAGCGFTAGLVAALRGRWWPAAVCLVMIAGLAIAGSRVQVLRTGPIANWADEGAAAVCTVRVVGDPRELKTQPSRPALALSAARTLSCSARGRVVTQRVPLTLSATGSRVAWVVDLIPGSTVRVSGLLHAPRTGQPVVAIMAITAPPVVVANPGPGDRVVNRFRSTLRQVAAANPADQQALLPSLVVGDTSGVSDDLADQFRVTALTHLMAVSGANLALVLIVVVNAARWAGVRGWWLRLIAVGAVAGFVVVCRAEPSVVRAAGMGVVALAALSSGRSGRGIAHLATAVTALVLIDPWLSRSIGFALSVAACAGILWWAKPWSAAMARWAPSWLAESICVPIAAQLATQPLVTALNGQVSVVGLAANAAAAPFVGPATVTGLVAGIVGAVWLPAGMPLGWVAGWLVAPIIWIARAGAGLPTPTWTWPEDPSALALLTVVCALLALMLPRLLTKRWLSLVLVVVLILAAIRPQPTPGWPGPWSAVACSVGQGDTWVLRAGEHSAVLVDVGPDPKPVVRCLQALGVTDVPMVVLTHFHADHITGLSAVLDHFRVGQLLVSPLFSPASNAAEVTRLAHSAAVPIHEAVAGQRLVIGALTWRTIRAGPVSSAVLSPDEGESSAENDSSVMGVATNGALSLMFAGDSEPAAQSAALSSGQDLRVVVLAMPHHGSGRQSAAFWRATGAVLAVASAGPNNDYGHPARAALTLAGSCGMRVARTDTQGSIAIWLSAGVVRVRTSER